MKCLVTGATGFVGKNLTSHLLDLGFEVIAISKSGGITSEGLSIQSVDFRVESVPISLLFGVDVVFHLAGIAHQNASSEDYKIINLDATVRLANQALESGVSRFVFLSSVKACRGLEKNIKSVDAYSDSKLMAEEALEKLSCGSSMAVDIVRSSLVYGVGVRGNLSLFSKAIRSGLPSPPEVGSRNMVSLRDLIAFLTMLLESSNSGVRNFVVTDGQIYSSRRIYNAIRMALGYGLQNNWTPIYAWHLMAFGADILLRKPIGATYRNLFSDEYFAASVFPPWEATSSFEDEVGKIFN